VATIIKGIIMNKLMDAGKVECKHCGELFYDVSDNRNTNGYCNECYEYTYKDVSIELLAQEDIDDRS
jgi:formylmethanofuran dehydrogenase subunit E